MATMRGSRSNSLLRRDSDEVVSVLGSVLTRGECCLDNDRINNLTRKVEGSWNPL